MKNIFISIWLILMMILTACTNTDDTLSERDKIINQMDPTKERNPNQDDLHDKLGFVRYKKDDMNDDEYDHNVTIDRTKMANMITRVILQNDGFDEVATLVTDKEVLIAYRKNEDIDDHVAAQTARGAGLAMLPRFFDVYVTDRETIINDIHSLHNSRLSNKNYQQTVNKIITEMEKSPQGIDKTRNDNKDQQEQNRFD